jgi:hypothetical protein
MSCLVVVDVTDRRELMLGPREAGPSYLYGMAHLQIVW